MNHRPTKLIFVILLALFMGGCSSTKKSVETQDASIREISSERKVVLLESRKWLGAPYRYGGNSRQGTDCSGLVTRVYEKVGVTLPRSAADMYAIGYPVSIKRALPGDLVFFQNTAGRGISHVGIYVGRQKFIHASTSKGVITSTLQENYYHRHYAGARKILK